MISRFARKPDGHQARHHHSAHGSQHLPKLATSPRGDCGRCQSGSGRLRFCANRSQQAADQCQHHADGHHGPAKDRATQRAQRQQHASRARARAQTHRTEDDGEERKHQSTPAQADDRVGSARLERAAHPANEQGDQRGEDAEHATDDAQDTPSLFHAELRCRALDQNASIVGGDRDTIRRTRLGGDGSAPAVRCLATASGRYRDGV